MYKVTFLLLFPLYNLVFILCLIFYVIFQNLKENYKISLNIILHRVKHILGYTVFCFVSLILFNFLADLLPPFFFQPSLIWTSDFILCPFISWFTLLIWRRSSKTSGGKFLIIYQSASLLYSYP